MYRAELTPPGAEAGDVERIADALRERAMRLTRWLDRASLLAGIAAGLAVLSAVDVLGEGSWAPAKLAYVLVGVLLVGAGRAAGRRFVRHRVARWVASAAREERIDAADLWRRIWTAY